MSGRDRGEKSHWVKSSSSLTTGAWSARGYSIRTAYEGTCAADTGELAQRNRCSLRTRRPAQRIRGNLRSHIGVQWSAASAARAAEGA
ncbi:hypothetical protein T261_01104 [Streptomyces lydicus]|nr:hypothetical protein T261_01104 [Streptomyces lydicus]